MAKTAALDFDGVLSRPATGYKMGELMPGAIEAVAVLQELGYKCIVFTVRATTLQGTRAVMDWLNYFKFPPMSVTAIKPNADVFIDDRAYRFTDWTKALEWMRANG